MIPTAHHGCRLRLLASPPPHVPRPALTAMMPLFDEDDFAAIAALPTQPKGARILVTMVQMQELMAALAAAAAAHLAPLELTVMTARMPAGPRIPARLLAPDVFIVGGLAAERQRLAARGRRFLTIDNRILRHPLDAGDNSVTLEWFTPEAAPEAWAGFVAAAEALGFTRDDGPIGEAGR